MNKANEPNLLATTTNETSENGKNKINEMDQMDDIEEKEFKTFALKSPVKRNGKIGKKAGKVANHITS